VRKGKPLLCLPTFALPPNYRNPIVTGLAPPSYFFFFFKEQALKERAFLKLLAKGDRTTSFLKMCQIRRAMLSITIKLSIEIMLEIMLELHNLFNIIL